MCRECQKEVNEKLVNAKFGELGIRWERTGAHRRLRLTNKVFPVKVCTSYVGMEELCLSLP